MLQCVSVRLTGGHAHLAHDLHRVDAPRVTLPHLKHLFNRSSASQPTPLPQEDR